VGQPRDGPGRGGGGRLRGVSGGQGRLQSTTKPKEFDRLVLELQRSKTAVALANEAGVPGALRARINKTLAEINRKVDKHVCKGITGRIRGVDKRLERFVGDELPKAGTKAGSSIDQFLRNNPDLTREGVMLEQRIQGFLRANPGLKRSEILVHSRGVRPGRARCWATCITTSRPRSTTRSWPRPRG